MSETPQSKPQIGDPINWQEWSPFPPLFDKLISPNELPEHNLENPAFPQPWRYGNIEDGTQGIFSIGNGRIQLVAIVLCSTPEELAQLHEKVVAVRGPEHSPLFASGMGIPNKLAQVGKPVFDTSREPLFPNVITPQVLPDIAPESRPSPWIMHDRGFGQYDVYATFRCNPRNREMLPYYVGMVMAPTEVEKEQLDTKMALINRVNSHAELAQDRPVPKDVRFYGQPGGCDVIDITGFYVESYSADDPQYADEAASQALTDTIKANNNEVVTDLKTRFQSITEIEDVADRATAVQSEYDRLEVALRFDDAAEKPIFFSTSQTKEIASFFRDADRGDLADLIDGRALVRNLWGQAQGGEATLFRTLESVMKESGISLGDVGIQSELYKKRMSEVYTFPTEESRKYLQRELAGGQIIDTLRNNIEDRNMPHDFLFFLYKMVQNAEKAGIEAVGDLGLTPDEILQIKSIENSIAGLLHSKCNEVVACRCVMQSEAYKRFFA